MSLSNIILWDWWNGNGNWWNVVVIIVAATVVTSVVKILSEIVELLRAIHEILLRATGGLPPSGVIADEYFEKQKHRRG